MKEMREKNNVGVHRDDSLFAPDGNRWPSWYPKLQNKFRVSASKVSGRHAYHPASHAHFFTKCGFNIFKPGNSYGFMLISPYNHLTW